MKPEVTNEDCLDMMARYPDGFFDLAVVDPPYGIGESGKTNKTRGCLATAKDYGDKEWDTKAPDVEYFNELKRVSKHQIIWGANHFLGWKSSCWIVWDKDNGKTDFADCELAYTSFKTAVRKFKYKWQGMLQEDMKNKEARIHPTQKPVALYRWILHNYAEPGQKILDTHLGSGSSRIAAHIEKMHFWGCELDTDYFEAQEKRFKQHISQTTLF